MIPHIKGNGYTEKQLSDLPEILPFSFVDQNNEHIVSDSDGIYFNMGNNLI